MVNMGEKRNVRRGFSLPELLYGILLMLSCAHYFRRLIPIRVYRQNKDDGIR